MYALSTPLLYKSMTIKGSRSPRHSSLQMVIRCLLSPSGETLATYVRDLYVTWDRDDIDLRREVPLDILQVKAAADSRGLTRSIISHVAQFLLLLHLLPRLHSLTIAPGVGSAGALGEIIGSFDITDISNPSRAPACFRFLREFHASAIHLPTKALLVILHLPCIRTVDFHLINDNSIGIPTIAAAARTSSVTHLRLQSGNTPAAKLTQIFHIPSGLVSLSFRALWRSTLSPISSFDELLHPMHGTLQHLETFLGEVMRVLGTKRVPVVLRLGLFYEWPALQSVSATMSALLGPAEERAGRRLVDVLPRGLRDLRIQRDRLTTVEQETEALVQLVQDETAVPGLRKLVVRHGRETEGWTSGLPDACEAAGVVLVDNGVCEDNGQ